VVRKMISSTVSFSRISQWDCTLGRNSLRNIGESQGFTRSGSRFSLAKLKKADKLLKRTRLVWGFRPWVSSFRKSRMWSTERLRSSDSPNDWQNRFMMNELERRVFFFGIQLVIIQPDFRCF
jgi:hypothetical protein